MNWQSFETTPTELQEYLTVAELRSKDEAVGLFKPAESWPALPGWFSGNLQAVGGCLTFWMFGYFIIPIMGVLALYRAAKRSFIKNERAWWAMAESGDDLLYQCLARLSASRFGEVSGRFTRDWGTPETWQDQDPPGLWSWEGESGAARLRLEVQERVDLASEPVSAKTRVKLFIRRFDGLAVVVPEGCPSGRGGEQLGEEEELQVEFQGALWGRQAIARGKPWVDPEDTASRVSGWLGDVLKANALERVTLDGGQADGVRLRPSRATAPSSVEKLKSLQKPQRAKVADAVLRRMTRAEAWRGLRGWWWSSLWRRMTLPVILGGVAVWLYSSLALIIMSSGDMSGLWLASSVVLIVAALLLMWRRMTPRRAARRVRGPDKARALRSVRGRLAWSDGEEKVELERPFEVQLSRSPSDKGSSHLNVSLSQRQSSGPSVRLGFRVPLKSADGLESLPELETRSPVIAVEDFESWVWPLIQGHAHFQGRALPWEVVSPSDAASAPHQEHAAAQVSARR